MRPSCSDRTRTCFYGPYRTEHVVAAENDGRGKSAPDQQAERLIDRAAAVYPEVKDFLPDTDPLRYAAPREDIRHYGHPEGASLDGGLSINRGPS